MKGFDLKWSFSGAGVPVNLHAADLSDYFNYNHLVFTGANANELLRNGRLKEGFYRFCFEALDYQLRVFGRGIEVW